MVLSSAAPQLADLDLLLSVDRLGSLGKAAREHGMSQPAASVRIQAMERRLGLRLLERSPSGSHFTPTGVMMAKWAQTAVDAVDELLVYTSTLHDTGSRSLRVASCLTMVEYLIPRWITGLHARLSDVTVGVRAGNSEAVLECARSGEADLGFVGDPCHYPDLHQLVVGHDELVVVVAPEHPWAARRAPLSPVELSAGRLVLRERGSGTREMLQRSLGELWCDSSHLELPSTTAIKEAVGEGAGAGVLSLLTITRELRAGWLVRVPVTSINLTRELRAVWYKNSELSRPARALLEIAVHEHRRSARSGPVRGRSRGAGEGVRPRPGSRRQVAVAGAAM